jgi:hypothetical protein
MFLLLTGLSILFIGQAIATPSVWRFLLAGAYLVLLVVAAVVQQRLARQAQRFLDEHPAPQGLPGTSSAD